MTTTIPGIDGFLLDMDGVLYHGDCALPHAADFMTAISGYPYGFITNNPVLPPERVAEKLARLGIVETTAERIVTSAEATADWLAEEKPGFRYFAVGGEGLHRALSRKGRESHDAADYVIVGEGGLSYDEIVTGIGLILNCGARLVGTNPDVSVDGSRDGQHVVLPGGGALVAPFAIATGVEPLFIGKPAPMLYRMALQRLGLQPERCLMIGDRPDTDIAGAQKLGMRTALVRTGRFRSGEPLPDGMSPPDFDVDDLGELIASLAL